VHVIRTALYVAAGIILGGIIHIVVILTLPAFATTGSWDRVAALVPAGQVSLLPRVAPGTPNPLELDPDLSYAVCRLDLKKGAGTLSGTLPQAFWSLAVYGRNGTVIYSTTNRDGIGQTLDVGIFNADQTRLLAQQKLDVAEGLLIVESPADDIFVLIRLDPPHQAMRARYEKALAGISCGHFPAT
jgi:uncharacterized membrane protein